MWHLLAFYFFPYSDILNLNGRKKSYCAAVNVTALYIWVFALCDNFYADLLFYELWTSCLESVFLNPYVVY